MEIRNAFAKSPGITLPPRGQLTTLREERKKDQVKLIKCADLLVGSSAVKENWVN